MAKLRSERNNLLVETDWMANSDVTMSNAWKKYRQDLRDITTQTPTDERLINITFPTKPKDAD
jgi:hypothetical protein